MDLGALSAFERDVVFHRSFNRTFNPQEILLWQLRLAGDYFEDLPGQEGPLWRIHDYISVQCRLWQQQWRHKLGAQTPEQDQNAAEHLTHLCKALQNELGIPNDLNSALHDKRIQFLLQMRLRYIDFQNQHQSRLADSNEDLELLTRLLQHSYQSRANAMLADITLIDAGICDLMNYSNDKSVRFPVLVLKHGVTLRGIDCTDAHCSVDLFAS